MTIGNFLQQATKQLQVAGIGTARLDCLILLEDMLGHDRARILAHPEMTISDVDLATLNTYITQRKKHIPLAYIRGKASFYGRTFTVNKDVLVPRPETETLIDALHALPLQKPRLADIGTGSGCIGITAKLTIPDSTVFLYDINEAALRVAQKNAQQLGANVHTEQSDLLQGIANPFDVLLANLPYVPNDYAINQAATFEPKSALFSGTDGLNHYQRFWQQITNLSTKPAYILTESLPSQHGDMDQLAGAAGYKKYEDEDFIQCLALK
jgi:release factor glutamine methyltransferase